MRLYIRLGLLLALVSAINPLRAITIISYGGSIQSSQYTLAGIEVAMSFVADADENITGGSLVGSGGVVEAQIEDFSNGVPSNVALSGGTATVDLTNPAVYADFSDMNVDLVQGQSYWIVLSSSSGASINLSSTGSGTIPNTSGDYTLNYGANWGTQGAGSGYYYPNLILTGTSDSVPEPGNVGTHHWSASGSVRYAPEFVQGIREAVPATIAAGLRSRRRV